MTEDSPSKNNDAGGSRKPTFTLKPTYKQRNPNPHSHSRGNGRSPFPTPATMAGLLWNHLGIASHTALAFALVPLTAILVYLTSIGLASVWLGICIGAIGLAYGIYYTSAPRESKHVIARLENAYHATRFASVSSGIALLSILSTLTLAVLIVGESLPFGTVQDTSFTIATGGMLVGLFSSYILVRVLVARALPISSNKPYLDRLVESNPILELLFIGAAFGAPAFIFIAIFFWNSPELFRLQVTLSRTDAGFLLIGATILYTAVITRL